MERRYIKKKYREDGTLIEPPFGGLAKGLKIVHIGNDVWKYGKISTIKGQLHQVVYGPERKEYHVWGKDVEAFKTHHTSNRHGNDSANEKVKIYILTSILDKKENWCTDLKCIPRNGKLKVIYENGTVKNIDFNGTFEPAELVSKARYPMSIYTREQWQEKYNTKKNKLQPGHVFSMNDLPIQQVFVQPVAYRIPNI